MSPARLKLLSYLQDHPGWHYGLDLVRAGVGSRSTVYIGLSALEEGGFVESRLTAGVPGSSFERPQYRATGKRVPDEGDAGEPLPA